MWCNARLLKTIQNTSIWDRSELSLTTLQVHSLAVALTTSDRAYFDQCLSSWVSPHYKFIHLLWHWPPVTELILISAYPAESHHITSSFTCCGSDHQWQSLFWSVLIQLSLTTLQVHSLAVAVTTSDKAYFDQCLSSWVSPHYKFIHLLWHWPPVTELILISAYPDQLQLLILLG